MRKTKSKNYYLWCGDNRKVLKKFKDNSFHSIVCDPPYHLVSITNRFAKTKLKDKTDTSKRSREGSDGYARLAMGFMGQTWDGGDIAFDPKFWAECFRVLKPGGYVLAMGGTRTYHHLATAIEKAGFEIRDCLFWIYGSGMPKSHNIGKAIDKTLGKKRKVIGKHRIPGYGLDHVKYGVQKRNKLEFDITSSDPVSKQAKRWNGWGTGLKPAVEPIVMARKPVEGTIARNVMKFKTGAINIDSCRINYTSDYNKKHQHDIARGQKKSKNGRTFFKAAKSQASTETPIGRWPANIIHDGSKITKDAFDSYHNNAYKFFYCSKPNKKEKHDACNNVHPTVKPISLMKYLVRMVTPKGGKCLDPFMGSGTTGIACIKEDIKFVGIDMTKPYYKIAKKRIKKSYQEANEEKGLFD